MRLRKRLSLIMAVVLVAAGCGSAFGQDKADSTDSPGSVSSASEAVSRVYTFIGFGGLRSVPSSAAAEMAALEAIEDDSTPFLGSENRGKHVWKIRMENVSLQLEKWAASAVRNQVPKDYEFWIDPDSGYLVKVTARYEGEPVDLPSEPPADSAAAGLRSVGEIWEGYLRTPPPITLQQAFEEAAPSHPLTAKEMTAVCVMWSYRGEPARPVWCITSRGIPLIDRRPGVPRDAGRMRSVVDATSGELIRASTSPELDWENWKGFDR